MAATTAVVFLTSLFYSAFRGTPATLSRACDRAIIGTFVLPARQARPPHFGMRSS